MTRPRQHSPINRSRHGAGAPLPRDTHESRARVATARCATSSPRPASTSPRAPRVTAAGRRPMLEACGASIMVRTRAVPNVPIIGSPTASGFPMRPGRRAGAGGSSGAANAGVSSSRTRGYTSRSAHFSGAARAPGAPASPRSTATRDNRPRHGGAGRTERPCSTLEQRWSTCRELDVHEANHPRRYEQWRQWHVCAPWREVASGELRRADDEAHRAPCGGAPWE